MLLGAAISAAFTYIPKFNAWFAEKSNEVKQLTMLGLMFAITAIMFGLGCSQLIVIKGFVCDQHTAAYFIYSFLWAAISNQAADRILPKPIAVRQAREIVKEDELYRNPE